MWIFFLLLLLRLANNKERLTASRCRKKRNEPHKDESHKFDCGTNKSHRTNEKESIMKVLFCLAWLGLVWFILPLDTNISLSTQAFSALFYKHIIIATVYMLYTTEAIVRKCLNLPTKIAKNGADTDDARYLTIAKFLFFETDFHFVCETSFIRRDYLLSTQRH